MNAIVWIVVGILLILSELLATSVVAVFIGLGALATGILLWLGLIDSLAWQLQHCQLGFTVPRTASPKSLVRRFYV